MRLRALLPPTWSGLFRQPALQVLLCKSVNRPSVSVRPWYLQEGCFGLMGAFLIFIGSSVLAAIAAEAGLQAGLFWSRSLASWRFGGDFTTCALPKMHAVATGDTPTMPFLTLMPSSHFSSWEMSHRCQKPALRHGAETIGKG